MQFRDIEIDFRNRIRNKIGMQFTGGQRVRRVSARVRFRISASVRARKIELRIQIAMY